VSAALWFLLGAVLMSGPSRRMLAYLWFDWVRCMLLGCVPNRRYDGCVYCSHSWIGRPR
jgi:hypothetical protein